MGLIQARAVGQTSGFQVGLDPLLSQTITTPLGITEQVVISNNTNFQFFVPTGATFAIIIPDPVASATIPAASNVLYNVKGIVGDSGASSVLTMPCMLGLNGQLSFFVQPQGISAQLPNGLGFQVVFL